MVRPHRRRAPRHSPAEFIDSVRIVMDPVALFERSFEIAEVYEKWLEAQAELFLALHRSSLAWLELFRALSGKQTTRPTGPRPARPPKRQVLPTHQVRGVPAWPPIH